MSDQNFDAIVIGSGISGGWAAKELTEKGLKVLMLERGRNIEHIKDYVNANKEAWDYPHRGRRTQQMIADYPVLKRDYPLNETNLDYWVDEKESPYTEIKRYDWFRGYHVGGRSLMWGRQSYRWSDLDFEANAKDGIAIDWPVRYKEIEPWYEHAEKFAGISGNRDGLPQLPDGNFLPPMDMTCVEKDVAKRLKDYYKGARAMIIGRTANITVAHEGRTACQFRNKCWLGCPFGAYFSTQSSTLPAAMKTGNLTLRPWSIVTKILYDKDKKRATGVEVLDAETNKTYTFTSKIVFLNASTFNSAWILMNSATDVWPDGLGSSSGELGHNIMDHHLGVGASGRVEGYEDKYYFGRRTAECMMANFRNIKKNDVDFVGGYMSFMGCYRERGQRDTEAPQIGADYKDSMSEAGNWGMYMYMQGETVPKKENHVALSTDKKDQWGIPLLVTNVGYDDNDEKLLKDFLTQASEMLDNCGIKNITQHDNHWAPGRDIHEMGGCRMGKDPKTSMLNKWNQFHNCKNVFVTDGACMTSTANQSPSILYMALTARATNYAVDELKKGNI